MKDESGTGFAGSASPFPKRVGRERAAVDVDVGPERRSPLTHPCPNTAGGSASPFLGRERVAVDVDVGPERRSPRPNTAGARGVGGKEPNGYLHLPTGSSYKHAQQ